MSVHPFHKCSFALGHVSLRASGITMPVKTDRASCEVLASRNAGSPFERARPDPGAGDCTSAPFSRSKSDS